MDEREALRKLKQKDEAAMEWFIERYAAYVSTIVYNVGGSAMTSADIEEISSDAFFTLWVNARRVLPGKVKAYLGGVARNKAKEYTRNRKTGEPLEDDIIIISDGDMERELEEREQAQYIRKAVLSMQYPEREIFFRYYYYCQPIAEISEDMNLNQSTVKTKLHRGRKKLKDILIKGGYTIED